MLACLLKKGWGWGGGGGGVVVGVIYVRGGGEGLVFYIFSFFQRERFKEGEIWGKMRLYVF